MKKILIILLLFSFCNHNSVNFPFGRYKPQGNWKLTEHSIIFKNDTTAWYKMNVDCDNEFDVDSLFNIYIKNTSIFLYTCSESVDCDQKLEMLSSETPGNLILRAPNGFGGYYYLTWFWSFYSDTLHVSSYMYDSLELRYKFIQTEDSIVCN